MKRTAIYPGSFNPFHRGHERVVRTALDAFDHVIVAIGKSASKPNDDLYMRVRPIENYLSILIATNRVQVAVFHCLLADYVNKTNDGKIKIHAVIKGIRGAADVEDERAQLYNNQDLGIGVPTFWVPADRDVLHISSTSIKAIEAIKGNE